MQPTSHAEASATGSLSAEEASDTKSTTSSASSADLHTCDYLQVMNSGVPTVFVKRSAVEAHAEAWLPALVASLNKQHGHVNVTTQVTDAQFREIVETVSPAEEEEEDGKASMVLSDGQSDLCPLMLNDNGLMFREMLRPGRVPPVECLAIACLSGASSCVRILLDTGVPTDKDVPAKWGAGHAGDSPLNSALRAITGKARFTTPRGLSFRPLEALQAGARECAVMILEHHRKRDPEGFSAKHASDLMITVAQACTLGLGPENTVSDMPPQLKLLLDARVDPNVLGLLKVSSGALTELPLGVPVTRASQGRRGATRSWCRSGARSVDRTSEHPAYLFHAEH